MIRACFKFLPSFSVIFFLENLLNLEIFGVKVATNIFNFAKNLTFDEIYP